MIIPIPIPRIYPMGVVPRGEAAGGVDERREDAAALARDQLRERFDQLVTDRDQVCMVCTSMDIWYIRGVMG